MTFKEKLKQEHPEKLDNGCGGGCVGCPYDYGYADTDICTKNDTCNNCWNSEMLNTPVQMTAEEAWELAKLVCYYMRTMSCGELSDIFGINIASNSEILRELSPYEVKAKIEEWERKQIRVGDVVSHQGMKGVVTRMEQGFVQILTSFGTAPTYTDAAIKRLVKTGKHIDIQSVLEQIGKEE